MFKEIRLKNFMSHVDTKLELAEGVNVIVGPNNCGKSAVVRALQVLCNNGMGDYMVRHDSSECSVTVVTDENHEITWRRKKGVPSYTLNDQSFPKVGRNEPPEEILQVLRMRSGEAEIDEFDVHFADQKRPIFLIDQAASKPAQFFASSSDAGRLIAMQRIHKKKVGEYRTEKEALLKKEEFVKDKLEVLSNTQLLEDGYKKCSNLKEQMDQTTTSIGKLQEQIQEMQRLMETIQYTKHWKDNLMNLKQPPIIINTNGFEEDVKQLSILSIKAQMALEQQGTLGLLCNPPQIEDVRPLESQIQELSPLLQHSFNNNQRLQILKNTHEPPPMEMVSLLEADLPRLMSLADSVAKGEALNSSLSLVIAPPVLAQVEHLGRQIGELATLEDQLLWLNAKSSYIDELDQPPIIEEMQPLSRDIDSLESTILNFVAMGKQKSIVEVQLKECADEIEKYVQAYPDCPTCGSRIDLERIIGGTNHV